MNVRMPVDQATTAEWSDLVDELDRWGLAGRVADLWWRDDDAVTLTPQLDDLLRLVDEVPVALAVIPALACAELAIALHGRPLVAVMQHGWQHANHARHGKKSEYPEGRSAAAVAAEIGAGQARLKALFGRRSLAALAPPWNRFAGEFLPLLRANGVAAISTMASPSSAALPPGLVTIDVHVDLVAWQGDRGFIGEAAALGGLLGDLRANRLGAAASAGPIGILTHHLIMDGPTTTFLDRLIQLIRAHEAAGWANPAELLQ
jgi:peptidoglycan/xylan/chitin deacetylase (PgdA/CDA1 family)